MSSTKENWLEALSTSNRPPEPQESSAAREHLQRCDQKLEDADARIAALEHELNELRVQRSIIDEDRQRYADILSVRRLLPPEIVARFMELAYEDANKPSHFRSAYQQVLSFMLVSREWYRTACGVAKLWTELDMDLTASSVEETHKTISMANKQSVRAAGVPLSLKIAFSTAAPTSDRIVGFIRSLKPRLGLLNLRIQVASVADLHVLDSLFHRPPSSNTLVWPALHTLQISIQSSPESEAINAESELSIPSANFPLLRMAAISSDGVTFNSYQLPWSILIGLDLGTLRGLELRRYISILRECKNLHSLRFRLQYQIGSDEIDDPTALILPHLTHLHLENTVSQNSRLLKLLSVLQVPSLQSCTYSVLNQGSYHTPIVGKLAELFRRSGCSGSMEYLELNLSRALSQSRSALGLLFKQVPHLNVLKISGYKMSIDALREVPCSVRDLSVGVYYSRVDDARSAFVKCLDSRDRYASFDNPLKARFHVGDTGRTPKIRDSLDSLKRRVGSSLDVLMD